MNEIDQLDLTEPRSAGELLGSATTLFARHFALFLPMTLLVVAPIVILVEGVWMRGPVRDATVPTGSGTLLAAAALELLMPILVTALHVAVVRSLGEGRLPDVREALRAAGPRFPAAVGASIFYAGIVTVGLIALVVPGVWLAVGGYFGAQIAVVERAGPFDAVMRSIELVRGSWWHTAGLLLAGALVFGVAFWPLDRVVAAIHPGVLHVTLVVLARALNLSLTALYGTLAYFSLRARKAAARPTAAAA
jgi:hypothetical protein